MISVFFLFYLKINLNITLYNFLSNILAIFKSKANQINWSNYEVLSLYMLIVQLLAGILLAMYYDTSVIYINVIKNVMVNVIENKIGNEN